MTRLEKWQAWWTPRRAWLAVIAFAVVWGLTDVRWRGRIDPADLNAHKTDFTVYTIAAEAFFDDDAAVNRDPYEVSNVRGWHYLYPPLFALLIAPLAPLDSQWQCVVWYFLCAAMVYGTFCECRRLLRWAQANVGRVVYPPVTNHKKDHGRINNPPYNWLCWAAGLAVLLPVMNSLQRGQVGVPIVYTLLLGLRLVLENRGLATALLGGVVLALPITIKLTPILAVGLLGLYLLAVAIKHAGDLVARRRAIGVCGGVTLGLALFVFVVPGLVLGHRTNLAHLQTWLNRVVLNEDVGVDNDFLAHSKRNQSIDNAVYRLGNLVHHLAGGPSDLRIDDLALARNKTPLDAPAAKAAVNGLRGLCLLAVAAAMFIAWRKRDAAAVLPIFGLACLLTLLVSPISWGHHYTVLLPAALFVPWWHWQRGQERLAKRFAWSAVALVAMHYFLLDLSGRLGVLGLGMTAWLVAASWTMVVALRNHESENEEIIETKSIRRAA